MSAPYAEECAKLCQHASFTTGCPACRLVDHIKDLAEAKSERLGAVEACQRFQDQLARVTNEQEREDAQDSVDQAQSHILAWDKRSLEIESALVDSRVAVKAICDANEPEALATAFAELAEEQMFELGIIWQNATGIFELISLRDADPNFEAEYEGLNRSQIPATADCLISEGEGLFIFMAAGRSLRDECKPTQTVGETRGPAFMSHGRALHMFGDALPPGADQPTAEENPTDVPSGEPSAHTSDTVQLFENDILEPLLAELSVASEPKTEAQFREMYSAVYGPTKSTVPQGKDPWTAVLGFNKFARWTPMLCSQYVVLVHAKKESTTVHGYEGWPKAGSLTFEGFTNWVLNCRAVDPLFGRATMKVWEDNMQGRKVTILEALQARTSKVLGAYTDAGIRLPRATQYYTAKESLLVKDAKKIGISLRKTKN